MQCPTCQVDMRKDGLASYPPGSKTPYGKRQRYMCRLCHYRVTGDSWIQFDRALYKAYQKAQFKLFLARKEAYAKAKEEWGPGGFDFRDL